MKDLFENNGAEFSPCKRYRYSLHRIWDKNLPLVMFIGLNPSTANETDNDATIRRVITFARQWGFGGVYMMNCFPLVSTDPEALRDYNKEVFSQHQFFTNNQKLKEVAEKCSEIIFAWGNFQVVKDLKRDKELIKMFPNAKALIKNKDGSPRHPLYVSSKTIPVNF